MSGPPASAAPKLAPRMAPRLAMYVIALRRKMALALGGAFDPYPPPPQGARLSPSADHQAGFDAAPLALSWARTGGEVRQWQAAARAKLADLTGWRRPEAAPRVIHHAPAPTRDGYRRARAYLRAWPGGDLPVDLVWRDGIARPAPVMICLQGTNSGAHLSWGEARMPPDPVKVAGGLDIARQAAARGYVAACVEQSCFGERRERALEPRSADPCIDASNHGLLLGRTLIGDRAADVAAVIDWLETATDLDLDLGRIHAMGNSSGGITALYAAALDERIAGVIAGGCVGPIRETIAARRDPSGQNVIPGMLNWLETEDVVALCAPRPVLAISGDRDHIFPAAGAAKVVYAARAVYEALGAGDCLRAVAADGPHRFYPDLAWPAFLELVGVTPGLDTTLDTADGAAKKAAEASQA